jgi:polyhydroxybutyrate depolymerase
MACEHADRIAAIVSLAGAMTIDPSGCQPSAPVSVLQAHGTADDEVLFDGFAGAATPGNGPYPSAAISAADWAAIDGCATPPSAEAPLDVDGSIAGAETSVDRYEGCKAGTSVELWSIQGGGHIPDIGATFREGIIQFLLEHPKP